MRADFQTTSGLRKRVNPEFALDGSKTECTRTKIIFFPSSDQGDGLGLNPPAVSKFQGKFISIKSWILSLIPPHGQFFNLI